MNIKECYKTMQNEWVKLYDVKVGTKVKVIREYGDNEMGCDCVGTSSIGGYNGQVFKIKDGCIRINCDGSTTIHPFFVLEVVGQPKPKKMTVKEISEMAGCTVEVVE